ncbi:UNVERIFIED_ORG: hypothetical protein J2W74_001997 [Methylorubrum zatmanii]
MAREFLEKRHRHPKVKVALHEISLVKREKPPEMSRAASDVDLAV